MSATKNTGERKIPWGDWVARVEAGICASRHGQGNFCRFAFASVPERVILRRRKERFLQGKNKKLKRGEKRRDSTPVPPIGQVEEKGFFERKMPETAKKHAKKERLSTLLFRMSDCGDPNGT